MPYFVERWKDVLKRYRTVLLVLRGLIYLSYDSMSVLLWSASPWSRTDDWY
jgi:hypothetical protein